MSRPQLIVLKVQASLTPHPSPHMGLSWKTWYPQTAGSLDPIHSDPLESPLKPAALVVFLVLADL